MLSCFRATKSSKAEEAPTRDPVAGYGLSGGRVPSQIHEPAEIIEERHVNNGASVLQERSEASVGLNNGGDDDYFPKTEEEARKHIEDIRAEKRVDNPDANARALNAALKE